MSVGFQAPVLGRELASFKAFLKSLSGHYRFVNHLHQIGPGPCIRSTLGVGHRQGDVERPRFLIVHPGIGAVDVNNLPSFKRPLVGGPFAANHRHGRRVNGL